MGVGVGVGVGVVVKVDVATAPPAGALLAGYAGDGVLYLGGVW